MKLKKKIKKDAQLMKGCSLGLNNKVKKKTNLNNNN